MPRKLQEKQTEWSSLVEGFVLLLQDLELREWDVEVLIPVCAATNAGIEGIFPEIVQTVNMDTKDHQVQEEAEVEGTTLRIVIETVSMIEDSMIVVTKKH